MPANDNRPIDDYDRAMIDYGNYIRAVARRWCRKDTRRGDPEDFVQDVYARLYACKHLYNSNYVHAVWIRLLVRQTIGDRNIKSKALMRQGVTVALEDVRPSTPARQDDYALLSQVIDAAQSVGAHVLLRHAMQEDFSEIGASLGVSRQRAHQMAKRERALLNKALSAAAVRKLARRRDA